VDVDNLAVAVEEREEVVSRSACSRDSSIGAVSTRNAVFGRARRARDGGSQQEAGRRARLLTEGDVEDEEGESVAVLRVPGAPEARHRRRWRRRVFFFNLIAAWGFWLGFGTGVNGRGRRGNKDFYCTS